MSIRLVAIGVGVAILATVSSYAVGRIHGRDAANDRHLVQIAKAADDARRIESSARARIEELDREHQAAIQSLEERYRSAADRIGAVRMCEPARVAAVPGDTATASGSDDAAQRDRLPEAPGERDIGPGLIELARLADRQTQRLLACQDYVRRVRASAGG
jgi:hypothetical protein